jgi:hypothetical protein
MVVQPVENKGQEISPPEGRVMGFVNSKAEFDAVIKALNDAGYTGSKVTVLCGDDGVRVLEGLNDSFFFSDPEYQFVARGLNELREGHYALAVEVDDKEDAVKITELVTPLGGHSFRYFGFWVSERLSK